MCGEWRHADRLFAVQVSVFLRRDGRTVRLQLLLRPRLLLRAGDCHPDAPISFSFSNNVFFSAQTSRFRELDSCQYEGFQASEVQMCYNSAELYGVNPRSPLGGTSTSGDAIDNALCVVKTNYAKKVSPAKCHFDLITVDVTCNNPQSSLRLRATIIRTLGCRPPPSSRSLPARRRSAISKTRSPRYVMMLN